MARRFRCVIVCIIGLTSLPRSLALSRHSIRQFRRFPTTMSAENHNHWIVRSLPGQTHLSSPSISTTTRIPTTLVLHFDINETILLGDEAGGDSRHDSVQKMIAKSAFCQLPNASTDWVDTQQVEPTHWWDGQPLGQETTLPPLYTGWEWPPGCCPYYRTKYKDLSKRFVDKYHGRIYKPVLDACEEALQSNSAPNHILPAFYHTLEQLLATKEPFRIVFRTFGSDIDEIAQIVTEFAQGKHPDYPHIYCPDLELPKENLYQGRWKAVVENESMDTASPKYSKRYIYELWNGEESQVVASGDAAIVDFLARHTICGIRDDYPFWKERGWEPTAGKPVWIPNYATGRQASSSKPYEHHLLFDDNIHNLPHDGIACVRYQGRDGTFTTLDGSVMHTETQGLHLIRVPTIEPVLNPNWYLEQIQMARDRLQDRLVKASNDISQDIDGTS